MQTFSRLRFNKTKKVLSCRNSLKAKFKGLCLERHFIRDDSIQAQNIFIKS